MLPDTNQTLEIWNVTSDNEYVVHVSTFTIPSIIGHLTLPVTFIKYLLIMFYHIASVLSIQLLVSISLATLITLLFMTFTASFVLVRYSLATYSRRTQQNEKSVNAELPYVSPFEKNKRGESRNTNYLEQFLNAIKVFGYLERPVFHEFTKNLTTQRLEADEILYLEESLGFLIVVEGTIQVYSKITDTNNVRSLNEDDELNFEKGDFLEIGNQKYQLLNEVKSGAPLSSLISTLDLFQPRDSHFEPLTVNHQYDTENRSPPGSFSLSSMLDDDNSEDLKSSKSLYPDIVARAKPCSQLNTATIAIIPSLAFRRVYTKYPKETSHIVTMVLTRLYKVTFNTINNYLGLTREIIHSEVRLNELHGSIRLPGYLYDSIKEKFRLRSENNTLDEINEKMTKQKLKKKPDTYGKNLQKTNSRYVLLDSRSKSTHPGDLLSSVPLSRSSDYYQTHSFFPQEHEENGKSASKTPTSSTTIKQLPFSSNTESSKFNSKADIKEISFSDNVEETEETSMRIAIVETLFKFLGIKENIQYFNSFSNQTSGFSSLNASVIGLSSLTKENDKYFSHYDPNSGRLREGSFAGIDSTIAHEHKSDDHFKFYNTIHQSSLKKPDPNDTEAPISSPGNRSSPLKYGSVQSEPNLDVLKDEIAKVLQIKYFAPGATLVKQKEFNSGLYYVIDGSLDVSYILQNSSASEPKKLRKIDQGGLAGYLSTIVGFPSLVTITASEKLGAIVAHFPKKEFSKMMDKFFYLQLPVASKLKSLLSHQIIKIDYALEWCHIPAGNVLCNQGDLANGFHIVLSGRFRKIQYKELNDETNSDRNTEKQVIPSENRKNEDSQYEILGEYGHGESIGEVEVLTASRRTDSLVAVRDSETARIPRTLFEILSLQSPSIMVKVSRIVASKVISKENKMDSSSNMVISSSRPKISNDFKTITILPTVSGLPVREFADRLVSALRSIGRNVIALDQASTLTHLGRHAFNDRLAHLKLSGYFAYLEEEYETIVYVCDTQLKSNWTTTCISQGDCILLLADSDDKVTARDIGDYERLLIEQKTTARTELCLMHSEKYVEPGSTSVWLKHRHWVHGHQHLQMEIYREHRDRVTRRAPTLISDLAAKISRNTNPNIKLKFESVKSKAILRLSMLNDRYIKQTKYIPVQSHKNDFLRLARILSNEAVGLVLGGGGSRGISHLGVVMALEKNGIPVDLVAGTSIGSFIGGLYAKDYNTVSIYGKAKKFSKRISSLWRSVLDLTYPVTSYITGYEFNRGIWKAFGDSEIEDFWIKYFCNSTNITNSTMDIHETGYLWRFIRASMSLAGLLPPISYNGCMLLDGGYLDNLPVLEMKNKGAKYIIAVDVGSADDRTPMNYGDTLSGFWVLFNRWNPFSKHPNVPSMTDIQMRLAYVASVNALERAKRTPGVIYLRPPIDNYATLDFGKFDEIFHVGMHYADNLISNLRQNGTIPKIAGMEENPRLDKTKDMKQFQRRNSI